MAMAERRGPAQPQVLRVVVVDDVEDIRVLLRFQLARDERFELVAEGSDGLDAIALAEAHQPDLLVLDRNMPRMGGVEAIPEIRRRSPDTAIVLYTAQGDRDVQYAALAAGALDVVDKDAGALGFVDTLVSNLLRHRARADAGAGTEPDGGADEGDSVEIRVGPVPSSAALAWVTNTRRLLDALERDPEVLDDPVPDDVLALFRSFLSQWEQVAAAGPEFRWVARAGADEVLRAVTYWAAVDDMTDEQLARLGVGWAPPEAEPFFHALTGGVLASLRRHDETRRLAARLGEQWGT